MLDSPAAIARCQRKRRKKFQGGTVLSWTVLRHPPAPFDPSPRCIGLIALDDGTNILAPLLLASPKIGERVHPRMQLGFVTREGLRVYEVAYEEQEIPVQRYILALTGPSGVGKTTIRRLLVKSFSHYVAPVPILTTRKPKEGDEGEYHYISEKQFSALERNGRIIAATRIPSTSERRWYGYRARDIEEAWKLGKLPVVITEIHLLRGLAAHYGRRPILSFGLLPPGKSRRAMLSHLLHRLRNRGRDAEEQIEDRMKNAKNDLQCFNKHRHLFDHILVNGDPGGIIETLQRSIHAVLPTDPSPHLA